MKTTEAQREYFRRHYLENREERLVQQRAYYIANRDRLNEQRRQRRATDPEHRARLRARETAWHRANREAVRERARARRHTYRLTEHGITDNQYEMALSRQCGVCGICNGSFGRTPYIDHDHTSGAFRGLLCHNCNVAIGHLRDDPELLLAAIAYIRKPPMAWSEGEAKKVMRRG